MEGKTFFCPRAGYLILTNCSLVSVKEIQIVKFQAYKKCPLATLLKCEGHPKAFTNFRDQLFIT